MRRLFFLAASLLSVMMAVAQTLNVRVGQVTYQFPAAQTGDMTFDGGTVLTIMGKAFTIADITAVSIDATSVTDNAVSVAYDGDAATVTVAGNVAQYVTPVVSGAHVSIDQSSDVAEEITYTLSGSSSDGEFYLTGSYKTTVELNGLHLTNVNPVKSGAAVHVQNGKRINVKVITGTENTLVDASGGSQKGCLYVKGHLEFKQKGTLNVYGNVKHAIKAGEYVSLKNATINVLSAAGDGISCNQYFLMESGTINISGTADDGIQCDLDGTESTGETADHEDEDTGNMYIAGGTINVSCSGTAAKGIKAAGDINVTGGTITVSTTGNGTWDTDDLETKAACGISSDGNITISDGTISLTSSGSGGKGMKCDGVLTIGGGTITVKTSGGLYYNNGSYERLNYTGDTEKESNSNYSSPKGIKAGLKDGSDDDATYSGGIVITGGTINVSTSGHNGEGIESKNTLDISGGYITVNAYDDAINSGQDMNITNGYVYAHSTTNDGIDTNGNCFIKGGLVYAIGSTSPEVGVDANTEKDKKLYVQGGVLMAIGGLEQDASLTQACYSTKSWTANKWYALTYGSSTVAFKTPSSGGSPLVVSAPSTPTLSKNVTVTSGTSIFDGEVYLDAVVSGGSSDELTDYSSSGNGPGGGGPGGGGPGGGGNPWGW